MNKIYLNLAIFFSVFATSEMHSQTITTIAGTGVPGYNGDNIAATIAQVNRPTGVKVDRGGNIYFADFMNSRVRRVGTDGFISTIAGTGTAGYNGDNIAGTVATLNWPEAIDLDAAGNVFIEDTYNHRIRKLGTNGFITTIAGTGTYGYNGDGVAATSANLSYPSHGVLVDASGNLIISDSYVDRIRKVTTNGFISTIAGTGTGGYNGDNIAATSAMIKNPYALVLDADGNLYFADGDNNRVRKISTTGIITTVAGTGVAGYNGDNILATAARLNIPEGLAFDAAGNLFISDSYNQRIRRIDKNTGIITTVVGTGIAGYNGDNIAATVAQVNYPVGIAIDKFGNLYIADFINHRVRKVNNVGPILPVTLSSFTATLLNGTSLLQWQTTNEINTQKFIIERSQDGVNFSSLDSIKAKNTNGKNDYTYTDASIKNTFTYYRLKIVDRDGKFTYSSVTIIKLKETISLGLSPNPVGNIATLNFVSLLAGKCLVQITDLNGRIISQRNTIAVVGSNKMEINSYGFAKGNYILTITNAEGEKAIIRFTK